MIHVTADIYRALADGYVFQPRGEIPIKGKGVMETYFLISSHQTSDLIEDRRVVEALPVIASDIAAARAWEEPDAREHTVLS
jgi:hypothetical protein